MPCRLFHLGLAFATVLTVCSMTTPCQAQQFQPAIAPSPGQPGGNYFLGVHTKQVQVPGSGPQAPVSQPTNAQSRIAPAIVLPAYRPGPGCASLTALQITGVVPGSAAARKGLEYGDIIVEANSLPITSRSDLSYALRNSGGYVRLVVRDIRTGRLQRKDINLTL